MNLDEILERLEGIRPSGPGWVARCPAHDDKSPSLSIRESDDGTPLLHCQAGCSWQEAFKAIGMNSKPDKWDASKAEDTYDYTDENGELLFQVLRMPGKEFPSRHLNGDGGWVWGIEGVRRVLYGLPQVIEAVKKKKTVVIVEGEKDVNALRRKKQIATCNPGGAGNWRPEYAEFFKDATVIIWPDNDEPGYSHARRIKKNLAPLVKEIHVVQSRVGKDASDHFEAGLSIQDAVPIELSEEDEIRLSDIDAREPSWHWKPFVQSSAFHLLAGDGGIGKGAWLAQLIASITKGYTEAPCGPENVLLVSSEDSAELDLKPRVLAAGGDPKRVFLLQRHILLPRDIDYLVEKIEHERQGEKTGLVVIDPVANHIGSASGDDETSVRAAINEFNFIAERTDCCIIGVRHKTKGDKSVLGSVAWVNSPRVVLMLDRIGEGHHDSGARVLRVAKSNRAPRGSQRYYLLEGVTLPGFKDEVPVLRLDEYHPASLPELEEEEVHDDWLSRV